jgi:hypothetical protein
MGTFLHQRVWEKPLMGFAHFAHACPFSCPRADPVIHATGERIPPLGHLEGWYPGPCPSRFFCPESGLQLSVCHRTLQTVAYLTIKIPIPHQHYTAVRLSPVNISIDRSSIEHNHFNKSEEHLLLQLAQQYHLENFMGFLCGSLWCGGQR